MPSSSFGQAAAQMTLPSGSSLLHSTNPMSSHMSASALWSGHVAEHTTAPVPSSQSGQHCTKPRSWQVLSAATRLLSAQHASKPIALFVASSRMPHIQPYPGMGGCQTLNPAPSAPRKYGGQLPPTPHTHPLQKKSSQGCWRSRIYMCYVFDKERNSRRNRPPLSPPNPQKGGETQRPLPPVSWADQRRRQQYESGCASSSRYRHTEIPSREAQ
eukprot:COSAG02_NODE_2032_length_10063_cov_11.627057_2_plen_214_part_00